MLEKREQLRIEHDEKIKNFLEGYSALAERRINYVKERETKKNNEIIEKMRNEFIKEQNKVKEDIQTLETIETIRSS